MSRIFREIPVSVDISDRDAHELSDCMAKLKLIYEELGDNHGYAVFAQIFGDEESEFRFYLTGQILTPDKARRIGDILTEDGNAVDAP